MRPFLLLPFLLAPSLFAQSLGDMRDLSDAYNKARSLAHSNRSSAPTWNEPTWNPTSGPSFTQDPPKTPEQKALEQRTEVLKKRITKLTTNREHWRVALERVQQNQDWRKDLKYYAEESQAAQIGALAASLSLLIGASGAVEIAMETNAKNAGAIFKRLGPSHEKLQRARALLEKAGRNPKLDAKGRQALNLLLRQHAELVTGMREQHGLMQIFKNLRGFADRSMDAVTTLELADDMIVKQDLALAQQLVTDAVIDILKEAGLVKLKRLGYGQITKGARLLTFTIDYCYQGAKFFDAWWNVDRILSQEEDRQKIVGQMGRTIVQITDKVTELKGDLGKLESAKSAGVDQQKQLLYEQRAKDYQQAHLMGEWFANESGIRAAGEPIN
ncbi:MAG: hypothetical protein Q8O00_06530 [Holophaga sp.]|nr:hypothetical protein [Holophaga sp.]